MHAPALLCLALSLHAAPARGSLVTSPCHTPTLPRSAVATLPRRRSAVVGLPGARSASYRMAGSGREAWVSRAEVEGGDPRERLLELGYDPELIESAQGARWDGQNQRWIRDENARWGDVLVKPAYGREYIIWPAVYGVLCSRGLKSISPEEAKTQMDQGAVLLDIREDVEFKEYHAAGAAHVPLFEKLDPPNTPLGLFYKLGYALVGVTPTDYNPNFAAQVLQTAGSKDRPIIVHCGYGGYLDQTTKTRLDKYPDGYRDPERAFGWESRSLRAAFELMNAGFTNVVHLEGGLGRWRAKGLGIEA